jgi:hypothetical protein
VLALSGAPFLKQLLKQSILLLRITDALQSFELFSHF